jgi:hypothetical protein
MSAGYTLASEVARENADGIKKKKKGKKSKINAKHKLQFVDQDTNDTAHKYMFKSVRSQVLQKLMVIWYIWFYSSKSGGGAELYKRYLKTYKSEPPNIGSLLECLKPEDVMETIGGSNRRTAIEYIQALKFIRPNHDYF